MKPFPSLTSCLGVLALALSVSLAGPVAAADPAAAPTASPGAGSSPSPSPTPVAPYPAFVAATVSALQSALADQLKQSGKQTLSVAAGGFRELSTGERSPLCERVEKDLETHLRDDTPFGVPSAAELQEAWISVGGNNADLTLPGTVRKFARLLSVDMVASGDYLVQGGGVSITVRLVDPSNGGLVWSQLTVLPKSALQGSDLDTFSGSAPPGYGQQPTVDAPQILVTPLSPSAAAGPVSGSAGALSPPAGVQAPLTPRSYAPPAGVRLDSNVHETEFSIYRANLGVGYKLFDPQNATFKRLAGDISGGYINLDWADILRVDYDVWYKSSLPSLFYPVSDLLGMGLSLSLTLPVRLGHHWVVYGGLGGRFETIYLSSPVIPSQDSVTFGNNSFFWLGGVKWHRGDWGLEGALSSDLYASYVPYLSARIGAYYEYTFE